MRLTHSIITALLSAGAACAASTTLVKNYCDESLYLTINNGDTFPVPSGSAWTTNIVGKGNTAVVTKSEGAFNAETPKLVLGTSSDLGVLYW